MMIWWPWASEISEGPVNMTSVVIHGPVNILDVHVVLHIKPQSINCQYLNLL